MTGRRVDASDSGTSTAGMPAMAGRRVDAADAPADDGPSRAARSSSRPAAAGGSASAPRAVYVPPQQEP